MSDLERCIHHKHDIEHVKWKGKNKPDCINCDGYGKTALKNGWDCYCSAGEYMQKNDPNHQERKEKVLERYKI